MVLKTVILKTFSFPNHGKIYNNNKKVFLSIKHLDNGKCYIHDIFIILSQQILNDKMLFAITSEQKSNFNSKFRLKILNTLPGRNYCESVVKML